MTYQCPHNHFNTKNAKDELLFVCENEIRTVNWTPQTKFEKTFVKLSIFLLFLLDQCSVEFMENASKNKTESFFDYIYALFSLMTYNKF